MAATAVTGFASEAMRKMVSVPHRSGLVERQCADRFDVNIVSMADERD